MRSKLAPPITNPYVLIVGCPRSGTTLLQRIVNAHPQIAIMPESHWIYQFFEKRRGLTPEGLVTPELISHLLDQPQFAGLQIGREELEGLIGNGRPVFYASFIKNLFDLYGRARGKARVGNKTPGFVRRIPIVHSLWPTARFVHLVRDGRDMYLSTMHRPLKNPKPGVFDTWEEDPVSTAALWWELNVRLGRQAGSWLGPELYYEIRYESLVHHPAQECAALCAFLGLPYDDSMLHFNEGQRKPDAARPITAGLRDWQSQMPPHDVEQFEAFAGKLLDELGYSRAFPSPQPKTLERALRTRSLFAQNPRNRMLVRELAQTAY
jgi:Sulfotransferase family